MLSGIPSCMLKIRQESRPGIVTGTRLPPSCGSRGMPHGIFLLPAGKQAEFLGDIQIDQQDVDGLATENTEEFALCVLFDDIFQMIF